MTVIRTEHQKNYVIINKNVLEDKTLSFKAKGIWVYCMSRPDDWQFHVSHLATVSLDGRDAVYAGLKELENAGYLKKVSCRDNGKYTGVDYVISELKQISPKTENPDAVNPVTANPPLVSIDSLPSIEKDLLPKEKKFSKEIIKNKLKKKFSFQDTEFDDAYKKLCNAKEKIFNVFSWLIQVIENERLQPDKLSRIEIHRKEAISKQGFDGVSNIEASYLYVEFRSGSFYKIVNYDVSDEEWREKTGWK